MDEQASSVVCGLIAGVLIADDDMHVHEASFLRRVRERFGLKPGTAVAPVTDPSEAAAKLAALPESARQEAFTLLIQAAAADGKIAPAERSFLTALAKTLQVDEASLDDRLQHEIAASKPQPFGLADHDPD
jgi:uncharacterized tellurite resistance protein B-like protein